MIFEEFAETKQSSNTTSFTVSSPPSTVEGDLLIAAIATDGDTKGSLSTSAEWNLIVVEEENTKVTLAVWWKIAGSSEPTVAVKIPRNGQLSFVVFFGRNIVHEYAHRKS